MSEIEEIVRISQELGPLVQESQKACGDFFMVSTRLIERGFAITNTPPTFQEEFFKKGEDSLEKYAALKLEFKIFSNYLGKLPTDNELLPDLLKQQSQCIMYLDGMQSYIKLFSETIETQRSLLDNLAAGIKSNVDYLSDKFGLKVTSATDEQRAANFYSERQDYTIHTKTASSAMQLNKLLKEAGFDTRLGFDPADITNSSRAKLLGVDVTQNEQKNKVFLKLPAAGAFDIDLLVQLEEFSDKNKNVLSGISSADPGEFLRGRYN